MVSYKLHLGCGNKKIYGWTNVDLREEVNPDLVCDISKISEKINGEAEIIYACHVLEHFDKHQVVDVLKDWYKALKPGGILRLSVPNIKACCEHYLNTGNLEQLFGLIWGGQKNPYDYHYNGFDYNSLEKLCRSVGFKKFRCYDWKETEHGFIDDYSQAYLPHMDKLNGKLMSLNVEAIK